jgi:hypothetical protein
MTLLLVARQTNKQTNKRKTNKQTNNWTEEIATRHRPAYFSSENSNSISRPLAEYQNKGAFVKS